MEGSKLFWRDTLAHEDIFRRIWVCVPQRHARKYYFIGRYREFAMDNRTIFTPGLLRAGFKAVRSRQNHDVLHKHSAVEPRAEKQATFHRKEQSDRSAKELEIP